MRISDYLYPTRLCNFFSNLFSEKVTRLALPAIASIGLGVLLVSAKRYFWSVTTPKPLLTERDLRSIQNFLPDKTLRQKEKEKLPETLQVTAELIKERRETLKRKREKNPEKYPLYLNTILDQGKIHLFDHMIAMKERAADINQLPVAELSSIVLEAKAMIMQSMDGLKVDSKKPIVFLLGETGGGKSTTLSFLAGDEMELVNYCFTSKGKFKEIISHSNQDSCTFLPLVHEIDEVFLVDFPGFRDTHGAFICLGIEFALEELLQKYQPKVLILESVLNSMHRYDSVRKLGEDLRRLLENSSDCILGLTRYSQEYYFNQLRKIEAEQKEEQAELGKQGDPLPDTKEKKRCREGIEKNEEEFKNILRVQHLLRFDDLTNPELRSLVLEGLRTQGEPIRPCAELTLTTAQRELINQRLQKDLLPKALLEEGISSSFASAEAFISDVKDSSLAQTIFQKATPDVGRFLHLPEMPLQLVHQFGVNLVKEYSETMICSVAEALDVELIHKVLETLVPQTRKEKVEEIKLKIKQLQEIIFTFGNVNRTARNAWRCFRHDKTYGYSEEKHGRRGSFKVPFWAKTGLHIQAGSMDGLFGLMRAMVDQKTISDQDVEAALNQYSEWLDHAFDAFSKLSSLKGTCEHALWLTKKDKD